uniref:Uncharacterized protein n=1 Tax=Triticum urartu TaxID=4572 RepID=A0A8R7TGF9_TRIUA
MRGVRARPPVSSCSSPLELIKTTVCIFAGRLCSNAMELVEVAPPPSLSCCSCTVQPW